MKLVLLEEAQQQFEAEDAWWRENRDAKELFIEEFSAALGRISSMPDVGQRYRRTRDKLIQRILMKKTRCHVYYFHDQEQRRGRSSLGVGRPQESRPEAVAFSLFVLR